MRKLWNSILALASLNTAISTTIIIGEKYWMLGIYLEYSNYQFIRKRNLLEAITYIYIYSSRSPSPTIETIQSEALKVIQNKITIGYRVDSLVYNSLVVGYGLAVIFPTIWRGLAHCWNSYNVSHTFVSSAIIWHHTRFVQDSDVSKFKNSFDFCW